MCFFKCGISYFSEFRDLHEALRGKYHDSLPQIPGKKLYGSMDPHFISQRMVGLQQYLDSILRIEPDVRLDSDFSLFATVVLIAFLSSPCLQTFLETSRARVQMSEPLISIEEEKIEQAVGWLFY